MKDEKEWLNTTADSFINWRNNLHSEKRGEVLMYDVKGYYKWLEESELFTFYMDFVHTGIIK